MFNDPQWELQRRDSQSAGRPIVDDIAYIRRTMDRAGSFTAIPGRGLMIMGTMGLFASIWAQSQVTATAWLLIWLLTAVVGLAVGLVSIHLKAASASQPLWSGPGMRFVVGLCPPLLAGAALTTALFLQDLTALIPGTWLLLYGAGVLAAGNSSVRIVPVMGIAFMILGTSAFFVSPLWSDWALGLGFGVLHLVFGLIINWRHGG